MKHLFVLFLLTAAGSLIAQERKTENVIVIALDGYRWKELFEGADHSILSRKKFTRDQTVTNKYWHPDVNVRREMLMPFFWNVIAREGQLYGNRKYKNKVNCKNNHLISYPGYSEMLVGFASGEVTSNDHEINPNATVLEFIHQQKSFHKKVAAFATWDAFPFILREEKSDIVVNAGAEPARGPLTAQEKLLNDIQSADNKRSDSLTYRYAFEHLMQERPRVMFISFDGTDHHAHRGHYDEYLNAANTIDSYIAELWKWIQSDPQYANRTTLLITTDHGRGSGRNNWVNHRLLASGSRHIWFAVLGPDTPAFGEMKFRSKYYQRQVAKTIAAFLGLPYRHKKPVGEVVQTMLAIPQIENPVGLSQSAYPGFSN